jgi:hypothetical protein
VNAARAFGDDGDARAERFQQRQVLAEGGLLRGEFPRGEMGAVPAAHEPQVMAGDYEMALHHGLGLLVAGAALLAPPYAGKPKRSSDVLWCVFSTF